MIFMFHAPSLVLIFRRPLAPWTTPLLTGVED
jgi:hypothetical protein